MDGSADGNPYLSGNFAPIADERSAEALPVEGAIPEALDGRLLRIGPNPVAPDPSSHHWFLGNGMVHGVRLRGGRAEWYRSRYVRDDEVVEARGWPAVAGPRRAEQLGPGVANTNIIGHAGKLLAVVEAGNLPVELDMDLETVGRSDFGGTLPGGFTAHPKRDPSTGELHACVYSPAWHHLQYVVVGTDGRVRRTVDVATPGQPMVHDCALTARYFILLDLPVLFDLEVIAQGFQFPFKWHPEYGARVGLLPREGSADQVIWCEVEPCAVFHPMNAYDRADGNVVLDVARHDKVFDSDMLGPGDSRPTLDRWVIDPRSGKVREHRLDDRPQEFPRHDARRVGLPYRYGYTAAARGGEMTFGALIKHDLEQGTRESREAPAGVSFMEPVFVPASDGAAEDEGWVMVYTYDAARNGSDVLILDARDLTGDPVATVRLPGRVPYGFHGNWVPA